MNKKPYSRPCTNVAQIDIEREIMLVQTSTGVDLDINGDDDVPAPKEQDMWNWSV